MEVQVPFLSQGWELSASEEAFRYHDLSEVTRFAGLVALGGAIAFVMELFEFLIVFKSSGLTLSIVGAVKVRTRMNSVIPSSNDHCIPKISGKVHLRS